MPLFQLIYRSHSRIPSPSQQAVIGDIFSVARSNNKAADVTGALLVSDDQFVQVLEGDEATVRALYERIRKDRRHERVTLVREQGIEARTFGRWSMARVSGDGAADIPLIANAKRGGAVPAADRPTTPEQDRVLDFMRDVAVDSARAT